MGLGTEEEEGYRTVPPGYIGWRNSFLGIDSGAPYTFKNTGSVLGVLDEPYSAKPAQQCSHTGPPGYIGWTRYSLAGLYGYSAERD